jgi:hypothetical protein
MSLFFPTSEFVFPKKNLPGQPTLKSFDITPSSRADIATTNLKTEPG